MEVGALGGGWSHIPSLGKARLTWPNNCRAHGRGKKGPARLSQDDEAEALGGRDGPGSLGE